MKKIKVEIVRENKYEIWAKCCFHDDKNASMLISKTGEFAGMFKCFGCSRFGKAEDLGIDTKDWKVEVKNTIAPIDWIKTNNLFRDNLKQWDRRNLMWMLARKWLVRSSILEELQCGYTGSAYTFPMYNEKFEIIGIQRYFENREKKVIGGSSLGVFASCCKDYNSRLLYITEGLSDTAVALDLGLPAIGRMSATSCNDTVLHIVKSCTALREVVIVSDNDKIGIKSSHKLRGIINKNTTGIQCRVYIPSECNDLRELRDLKGNKYAKQVLG